jgi:predicted MPP superfamily phosphohydrolase
MPAHSIFLLVSLASADSIVLAPALGIALIALRKRREVTSGALTIAWFTPTRPAFAFWASHLEPLSAVKDEHRIAIAKEHAPSQPSKIAVLAEIQCEHVTDHEREAIAMSFAPDLILLPGDLSQFSAQLIDERAPQWRELLAPLDAQHGVYFVLGNCD